MTTQSAPVQNARHQSYWTWEVFLMGGASVVMCLGSWFFFEDSGSLGPISTAAFALAFIANHPHFAASYTLLYGDFRHRILRKPGYFWAGVIVPLILTAAFVTAFTTRTDAIMGHIITAMYFFVGWHYAKQVFGCIIVTSVRRKIFYSKGERQILLTSLIAIWAMSWSQSHILKTDFDFRGISHMSFRLSEWVASATVILAGITVAIVIAMHIRKYILQGTMPSPPGVVAYLALLIWFTPKMSPAGFAYMIPFFHSLQYLTFVWVLKKNETAFNIRHLKDREWRAAWVKKFWGYALVAFTLGALFFEFIPRGLDALGHNPGEGFGPEPFMASILLFINVHHYFIDNIIWKSNNETVKQFLFQTDDSPALAPAAPQEEPLRLPA